MSIVPVPLENCSSVRDYFERGGKIEIPRPLECKYEKCLLKSPLRKNGGYFREVVYWGFAFLVYILRFRCGKCGRTISCPYSWLLPYCRFPAEIVAESIDRYSNSPEEDTYRNLSSTLSDLEFVVPEQDIRQTDLYRHLLTEQESQSATKPDAMRKRKRQGSKTCEDPVEEPSHTTVWTWLSIMCKQCEKNLTQIQKELVREWKRRGRRPMIPVAFENPNSKKAFARQKPKQLDLLTLSGVACLPLIKGTAFVWSKLRAYFLQNAETCWDVLTRLNTGNQ